MECDCCSQVVVVDKLDYCATLNNLTVAKENPNFKVTDGNFAKFPSQAKYLTL